MSYFQKAVELARDINQRIDKVVQRFAGDRPFSHNELKRELQHALPTIMGERRQINIHCVDVPGKSDKDDDLNIIESIDFCFDQELKDSHCNFSEHNSGVDFYDTSTCDGDLDYLLPWIADLYLFSVVRIDKYQNRPYNIEKAKERERERALNSGR